MAQHVLLHLMDTDVPVRQALQVLIVNKILLLNVLLTDARTEELVMLLMVRPSVHAQHFLQVIDVKTHSIHVSVSQAFQFVKIRPLAQLI